MASNGKDILQGLTDKLKVALDEVQQIKKALSEAPEVEKMRDGLRKGGEVVSAEASKVFEELGRETYRLVKAGKVTVPEAIRSAFEMAESALSRFDEPPAEGGDESVVEAEVVTSEQPASDDPPSDDGEEQTDQ